MTREELEQIQPPRILSLTLWIGNDINYKAEASLLNGGEEPLGEGWGKEWDVS